MDGNALPQLFSVRKCNFRISYAHSYIGYLLDLYCQSGMSNARMHEGLHFTVCIVLLIRNFEDKPEAWAGKHCKRCLTFKIMNTIINNSNLEYRFRWSNS